MHEEKEFLFSKRSARCRKCIQLLLLLFLNRRCRIIHRTKLSIARWFHVFQNDSFRCRCNCRCCRRCCSHWCRIFRCWHCRCCYRFISKWCENIFICWCRWNTSLNDCRLNLLRFTNAGGCCCFVVTQWSWNTAIVRHMTVACPTITGTATDPFGVVFVVSTAGWI